MPMRGGYWRNAVMLAGIYLYILAVVLAALWFFRWREGNIPWWTDIPVGFLAIGLIGPAQHRLLLLGQEACLGCLFPNKFWNDFIGDWFIHFPFSTNTSQMRHVVLAHYQHPDDPKRDAEQIIAMRTGFWPLKLGRLLRLTALISWTSLRANYFFGANPDDPYQTENHPRGRLAFQLGAAYVLIMFAVLIGLYLSPNWWVLVIVPPTMWILACTIFGLLPHRFYYQSILPMPYSNRVRSLMQITFITLVNLGLGWASYLTERSGILNYIALWVAPMVTTTAWCMIIRHARQHGAGMMADLPIMRIGRRLLIFPLNQHFHQTKHDFPNVPWYHLPEIAQQKHLNN